MELNIKEKDTESSYVLKLSGEVDAFTAPQLKEALLPLTEKQGSQVIVDLAATDYMDSTGLGVLIAGYKSADKNNSQIIIRNANTRVQRLFNITGVAELFHIENERSEEGDV